MTAKSASKNSTPAVVVLLIILAGAIAVTIVRLSPKSASAVAGTEQPAVAAQAGSGSVTVAPAFSLSHNPFRKPDAFRTASNAATENTGVMAQNQGTKSTATGFRLDAMPIGKLPSSAVVMAPNNEDASDVEATNAQKPAEPEFALLATVAGSDGISAVIRKGGANTTVIEVGDVVDGGYTVQKIDRDQAVLKNGVDIVVVKRPD